MKRGFSMIELIFVIVILGILASVALPKLAATRDDATASGIKTDVGTLAQAVPALYMSQKIPSITQAVPSLSTSSWVITSEYKIESKVMDKSSGSISPCIRIQIEEGNNSGAYHKLWTLAGSTTAEAPYPVLNIDIAPLYLPGTGITTATQATGACDTLINMGIKDQNISLQGLSIVW